MTGYRCCGTGVTDWYYFEAEKDYSDVGFTFFVDGWIAGYGAVSFLTEVRAGVGGALSLDNPEASQTDVLGVIHRRDSPEAAAWVIARRDNLDLIYELYHVGRDPEHSVKNLLRIWASHCLP